jgi:D-alanyl-D-alanine carboxypeptidase
MWRLVAGHHGRMADTPTSARACALAVIAVVASTTMAASCSIRTDDSGSLAGGAVVAEQPPPTTEQFPADTTTTVDRSESSQSTAVTTIERSSTTSTKPYGTTTTTEAPLTGWAATDAYLKRRIIGGGSNAASFAIMIDGELVHTTAMGVRSLSSVDPAEPQDRFRIASISKTITAITVLQLVEDGFMGLDDPVGALIASSLGLEAQPGGTADITARQLLTHTSGFAQNENLFFNGQVATCRDAAAVAFSNPLQGVPGTGYRYSNMNFCVLGLLIEGVTAQPYESVVYERLLTPLGISGMRLAPTYDPGPDEIEHRTVPGRNYMEVLGAAGAWVATPSDLVTIINSLDLGTPGWKPLDEATVMAMKTSANDPLAPDRGYGMGLILYGFGAFGHTGTVESTHAMVVDRNDGVSWAVTVSGEYPSDTPDLAKIVDDALVAGGFVAGAPLVTD